MLMSIIRVFASHSCLLAAQQDTIKPQLAIRNGSYIAFVGGVRMAPFISAKIDK
jgi:uncharacterized membrane protein (DUF441 family)